MKELKNRIRQSISSSEKSRLEELKGYKIIRSKSSRLFDELAAFTANLFNTQVAVINFVDQHNVWVKKGQPLMKITVQHVETNVSSVAIANESANTFEMLFTAPSLFTNALVAAELGMGFYAAVPIVNEEGMQIGTVCILDKNRRVFLPEDQEKLEWIAGTVQKEMTKKTAQSLYA